MPSTIPESDFKALEDKMDHTNTKKYVYDHQVWSSVERKNQIDPQEDKFDQIIDGHPNWLLRYERNTNHPNLEGIDPDEIEGRFCMELGGYEENTLFFACTTHITIPFSILKGRTIDNLKKHRIYFKIHHRGFKYRVNWSPIIFLWNNSLDLSITTYSRKI